MDFGQHLQELHTQSSADIQLFERNILTRAVRMLQADIQNPLLTGPDQHPDAFMARANQIGLSLLENGFFSLAERLYRTLAEETIGFRRDPDRWRHAGALFANTGVACAAQRNIDQAVIELLKAAKEDERTYNIRSQDSFAITSMLQEYFGKPVRNKALTLVQAVNSEITLADVEQISSNLGSNEYALWSYIYIASTHEEANKIFKNIFSDLQIFSSIRNISSLLEFHLKSLIGNPDQTFFPAISSLFNAKPWWNAFETERRRIGATQNSGMPIDHQLRDATLIVPYNDESLFWKSLLIAYIARNYSVHQMDISNLVIQSYSSDVLGHILNVMILADGFR